MKLRLSLTCLALCLLGGGNAFALVLQVPDGYPTIQAAVDAAAGGDTIAVAAGTYEESLNIGKRITISGAGRDLTIVRCPKVVRNVFDGWKKPIVFVHDTPQATVQDLTIDGYLRALPDSSLIGAAFWNAGGTLRRCLLRDLREPVPGYGQTGVGVYAYNGSPLLAPVLTIDNVRVQGYQKSGLALYGYGLHCVLTNVEIDGENLATPAAQNGLEFGLGASALVTGARVTGNLTSVLAWTACGILTYYAGAVELQDCQAIGNETSIYYIGTPGRIEGCRVEGVDALRAGSGIAIVNSTGLPKTAAFAGLTAPLDPVLPFVPEPAASPVDKTVLAVIVDNCDIIGHQRNATAGVAAFAQLGELHVTVMNSLVANWDYGLDMAEGYSPLYADCRHNQVVGNMTYGAVAVLANPLDARLCWWGDPSGPWHPVLNPTGTGNQVSDFLVFLPFTDDAHLTASPAAAGPLPCGATSAVTWRYEPHPDTPDLRGFEMTITLNGPLSAGVGDFVDLDPFAGLGPHFFGVTPVDARTWTVSCALLGGEIGLDTAADLFRLTTHATATGAGAVAVTAFTLRALDNGEIATSPPADALVTVDCDPPGAVTGPAAAPHHQRVSVSWIDPPADTATLEVWRGLWHDGAHASAYPEYDDLPLDVIPPRPADRAAAAASADWALAGSVPAGAAAFDDTAMGATRGVYCYEVFARDAAGNYGPPAAAGARATSYWLGDVSPYLDGSCDVGDISRLGACFGASEGDASYDPAVDVGPTDDCGRFGVPTTDSRVDFEDLMIFAMNFGFVTPTNKTGDRLPPAPAPTTPACLAWRRVEARVWALDLGAPCPALQGLRVTAPGAATVTPGPLLAAQRGPSFVRDAAREGLDVGLALLGAGAGMVGQGELLRLALPPSAADAPPVARFVARNGNNAELPVVAGEAVGSPPAATRLLGNVPNPFNPSTTVRFALAAPGRACLRLFALDGRLVRTLVDAELPTGEHTLIWDGRDDRGRPVASGAYVCRFACGGTTEARKMTLTK
ncbi:MAG: right-handed parallel beta-helix repeat-containing protein [Candidatus Krumholzibacteriia bacterium]